MSEYPLSDPLDDLEPLPRKRGRGPDRGPRKQRGPDRKPRKRRGVDHEVLTADRLREAFVGRTIKTVEAFDDSDGADLAAIVLDDGSRWVLWGGAPAVKVERQDR